MLLNENNLSLSFDRINAFGNVDGLNLQNLFYSNNGYFPNIFLFSSSGEDLNLNCYLRTIKTFEEIKTLSASHNCQFQYVEYNYASCSDIRKDEGFKESYCNRYACVIPEWNIYVRIENVPSECYILYSHDSKDKMLQIKEIISSNIVSNGNNNVYLIASNHGDYYLTPWKINPPQMLDVTEHYNDDFQPVDKTIRGFMDSDKSGLVLLHGLKGTGKTTYIRNLIASYPERKFVFIHPSLVPLLGSPEFGNFLSTLKDHVIILEDCENAIRKRKSIAANDSAVALLLNLTDGLLSDDLRMKFICTFNDASTNIDDALTRKGRLVARYEFKKLCEEKATALLRKVTKNDEITSEEGGMSLADIYYYSSENYEQEKQQISF